MELAKCDVASVLVSEGVQREEMALKTAANLIAAMEHVHAHGIVHR
jgi:serine/threonine protein kinase